MRSLNELARLTYYVLLDFDGPTSDVFAGDPAPLVAKRLHGLIGDPAVISSLAGNDDPMQVLGAAAGLPPERRDEIEALLRAAEVQAVRTAEPTPGVEQLLTVCRRTGRRVAMVSNNSAEAVTSYLVAHGLDGLVDVVAGRRSSDPALMKPDPHLVDEAVAQLGAERVGCLLVGDSVTDIESAVAAGVPSVGYANKPGKAQALAEAGADAVIEAIGDLAEALEISPPGSAPNLVTPPNR